MIICPPPDDNEVHSDIAICKYEDGADIDAVNKAYMRSKEFRADMKGFKVYKMRSVKDYTVDIDNFITERNL